MRKCAMLGLLNRATKFKSNDELTGAMPYRTSKAYAMSQLG
jgi:hypothetical protein